MRVKTLLQAAGAAGFARAVRDKLGAVGILKGPVDYRAWRLSLFMALTASFIGAVQKGNLR